MDFERGDGVLGRVRVSSAGPRDVAQLESGVGHGPSHIPTRGAASAGPSPAAVGSAVGVVLVVLGPVLSRRHWGCS
ncbi:hypothetical protein [Streptomyces torulosus]|uniref:hypothetical protein n=1 Tax=Streptomyces torulosus TaxID=68276 RepID=UPI000AD0F46C|nr:hypothetical protein [Streptomyces torulosus]